MRVSKADFVQMLFCILQKPLISCVGISLLLGSHTHLTDRESCCSSAVSSWCLEILGQMVTLHMLRLSLGNWSKNINADRLNNCKIQFTLT